MSKLSGNALFETAPVPKAYFALTIPGLLAQIVNIVYNMADTYFIALTGNTDLVAGVSLCAPFFLLTVALGDLFGLGSSSVMARLFGQREDEAGRRVSSCSFWAAILCGAAAGIVMLLCRAPLLHLLGAEGAVFDYASEYFTWLAVGAPVLVCAIVPVNQLRTEGLTRESMFATVTGSIVNIILDPIFIFGLGMGAAGAAIATVLGNLATVLLQVRNVRVKAEKLSVSVRDAHITRAELFSVVAIGFPASINNLMQSFSQAMLNRSLIPYGVDKVAAFGISGKVYMILIMTAVSFAFGCMSLIGFNYGSGNTQRLRQVIRFDLMVELTVGVVGAVVLGLFAPQIIGLFMDDPAIVSAGAVTLRCMIMAAPIVGVFLVFSTLFQAAGKAIPTTILALSRQGAIFFVCLFLLNRFFGYYGVLCTQAASDVLTLGLTLVLFKKSGIKI